MSKKSEAPHIEQNFACEGFKNVQAEHAFSCFGAEDTVSVYGGGGWFFKSLY